MGDHTTKSEILEYIEALVIAIILALFIITFIAQSFVVDGSSMEPTLHNHERLLVNKFIYRFKTPVMGDIVVFKYPADPRRKFIKRVIGKPGDQIQISNTQVFVNSVLLREPYIMSSTLGDYGPKRVPEKHLFVMGDNRNNSEDSRYPDVGFVPFDYVVGKAFVVYWPLNRFSFPKRQ